MKRTCGCVTFKELKELKEAFHLLQQGNTHGVRAPRAGEKEKCRSDEEIFREAMADVREIKEFREIPFVGTPEIRPRPFRRDDTLEVLSEIVAGKRKIRIADTGEFIEGTLPEMRRDISVRLHRGDFSVQDFIDLHGMTVGEAEKALGQFFREAVRKRLFCVKVIHGRGLRSPGGPVLKEALRNWLHGAFRKWTAAYATAKDCDGGLGATYIILKSK